MMKKHKKNSSGGIEMYSQECTMGSQQVKRILHGIKRKLHRPKPEEARGEKGPDFYDQVFLENEDLRVHYTASSYYFIWTVIVDRIRRARRKAVLEVGCGTGQLAHAIYDAGMIQSYCGLDFSKTRIEQARRHCPAYRFEAVDVFQTRLFEDYHYDVAIATEFLEHIEHDLDVIRFIRPRTYFVGTVPNFPYVSHVRHFQDCDEVIRRYAPFFTDFKVDAFRAKGHEKIFFLLEGIKI